MAVQTFNPTDLSQSATNWAVAQRIVGSFAPHAQATPNLTLALDAGHLLNGTTLTEVNAQSVGPITPPTSGFRIDRVVIDRLTGAASVITGVASSLTPPAIPAGKLPAAQVMLVPTSTTITNDLIVDERALVDLSSDAPPDCLCRAHRNGVDQGGIANNTWTKLLLTTTSFNVGNGFDTATSQFKPSIAGWYNVRAQATVYVKPNCPFVVAIYKNGGQLIQYINTVPVEGNMTVSTEEITQMNGSTDYIECFVLQSNGAATTVSGHGFATVFMAQRIQ